MKTDMTQQYPISQSPTARSRTRRGLRATMLLLLCLPLLTACKGWFDISPKSELKADDLLRTEQGFRDALMGCYALMADADLYGASLTYTYADVLAGYYPTAAGTLHSFRYAYAYDYANSTEEARTTRIWKDLYNVIANLNNLLQSIDQQREVFADGNYALIRGEALGLRAYLYLDLLRLYAPAPADGGLGQPAVPWVDTFTNAMQQRSTTGQVLDHIVSDLQEARLLLAPVDPYGPRHADYDLSALTGLRQGREYRMNYYAATALLARTCLYRSAEGDQPLAAAMAQEVIQSGLFPLISSEDITSADQNGFTQENIFALEYRDLKEKQIDSYFYAPNTSSRMLALNAAVMGKLFPAGINADYRRQYWLSENGSNQLVCKYDHSNRIPLLKVGEMYLIATETAPTAADQATWYNALRYHRGLPDEDLQGQDLPTVLRHEYAREFLAEGQLFFACKRMGYDRTPIMETVLADPRAVYTLPLPTDNTYFAP